MWKILLLCIFFSGLAQHEEHGHDEHGHASIHETHTVNSAVVSIPMYVHIDFFHEDHDDEDSNDEDHEGHDHGDSDDEDHEGHDHGDSDDKDHEGHDHGDSDDEDHEGHDHGDSDDEDHEGHDHGDSDDEDHEGHDHGDSDHEEHEEKDELMHFKKSMINEIGDLLSFNVSNIVILEIKKQEILFCKGNNEDGEHGHEDHDHDNETEYEDEAEQEDEDHKLVPPPIPRIPEHHILAYVKIAFLESEIHHEEDHEDHAGHDHGDSDDADHEGHDHGDSDADDHEGHDHGDSDDEDHEGHDHGDSDEDHHEEEHGYKHAAALLVNSLKNVTKFLSSPITSITAPIIFTRFERLYTVFSNENVSLLECDNVLKLSCSHPSESLKMETQSTITYDIWLFAILANLVCSIVSIIGIVFIAVNRETLMKYVPDLLALACGTLLGAVLFGLLPEGAHGGFTPVNGIVTFLGIFLSFLVALFAAHDHAQHHIRKTITSRQSATVSAADIEMVPKGSDRNEGENLQEKKSGAEISAEDMSIIYVSLLADTLHNFIDGILIGSTFMSSISLGWTTTLAITLHELPTELGDFVILINAGWPIHKAIFANFLVSLTAILGSFVSLGVGGRVAGFSEYALNFATGQFLYLAMSMLIPELISTTRSKKLRLVFFILIGLAIMSLLLFLPHSHGDESSDTGNHDGHNH